MSRHANFTFESETPECVTIRDNGPWDMYLTISNDAEWVVSRMIDAIRPGQRLEYIDSDGDRDELLIVNGKFAGFGCIRRTR